MRPEPSAQTLEILHNASLSLQAGRHVQAREVLAALIRAQPACFEAHRLLATSLLQTGEFARAQRELRVCLRLRNDDGEVALLLGKALSAAGQSAEAMRVLAEASQAHPGDVAIACAWARALLTAGRAGEALQALQRTGADAPHPALPEFWMLSGHARMALGQPADAAAAFREWLRLEPANHEARMRLAAALADAQRNTEAEAEIRACIDSGVRTPEALFVLARALLGQGRFDEAEAQLREVVRVRPDHVTAQGNLSELVWMRTGDAHAACIEIDAALRVQPRLHALRVAGARLFLSARRAPEALADIDAGLALDAQDPALLKAAATIALDFDGARALGYARRAMGAAPQDRGAQVAFGNALLAVGEAQQALDVATRLHATDSTDGQAVAMLADALRMAGDDRYRELLDYRHFVRADYIDTPTGWPSLEAYLADLQPAIRRAHTLNAHPIGNSLRHGSQVLLVPEQSMEAAIRAFAQAIDGPIRRYMQALGAGPDVVRRRNTGGYRLSGMWSVRLRPQGFHVNHYHPEGWLSSACYLQLPPAVATHHGEGWLKFGEPAFPTHPILEPEYFLKPEPGLLVLFPSYMWHGTVPFSGAATDSRVTIAFDVIPAIS